MEPVFQAASESPVFTGIANVGGTIAAIILAFKFAQWLLAFFATAYRKNILTAWFRYRRRVYSLSVFCALDLHYYVSTLARRLIIAFMGLFTVSLMQSRSVVTEVKYNSSLLKPLFHDFEQFAAFFDSVDNGLQYATAVIFLYAWFRLFQGVTLAYNVQRLRFKWRKRKHHSRLSGKSL